MKPTREHLEAVSRLLQACTLCGAKYSPDKINMPDSRIYKIEELVTCWRFTYRGFRRTVKKSCTAEQIKDQILEFHVTITQQKACPSFIRW